MPILRDPRVIKDAYDRQLRAGGIPPQLQARLDVRIDAAVTLFRDWKADPGDRSDYNEALRGLLQGLTMIQRIVVLQSINSAPLKRTDYEKLNDLLCKPIEPRVSQQ